MTDKPFDPLSKPALAESIALQLQKSPAEPLPPENKIVGSGIYALYYSGDFAPYLPISKKNKRADPVAPIYVGKAVPKGSRKEGPDWKASLEMHCPEGCRNTLSQLRA